MEIENIIRECQGDKVAAIKRYREITGASLPEAKEKIEASLSSMGVSKGNNNYVRDIKNLPGADTFGTKKELQYLKRILENDESVKAVASGLMGGNTWLLASTNKRILFIDCGMIYGVKQEEIKLDHVNAISFKSGLIMAKIIIRDGARERVIENVQKAAVKPFVDATNRAIADMRNKPINAVIQNQATNDSGNSVADELIKLKGLLDAGVLTQDEFNDQKKKILNK